MMPMSKNVQKRQEQQTDWLQAPHAYFELQMQENSAICVATEEE